MTTVRMYHSPYGLFEIPIQVWARHIRWRESRPDYLDHWCRFQFQKAMWVAA